LAAIVLAVFPAVGELGAVSQGEWHTEVTDSGRLGWTDGTGPPGFNHAHHADELLRGNP
jgi:hypothetical protein